MRIMIQNVLGSVGLALLTVSCATAQYGYELQAYPAGIITGPRIEWSRSEREVIAVRPGWNITDRRDFGEHDDEQGDGPGIGVNYRRWLAPDRTGWLFGGRLDLWWLEIDWKDDPGKPSEVEGKTDVVVLQPTLEGGYSFRLSERWRLDLTLGLGAEINVDTDGEDVGEGAILLGGISFSYGR